MSVLSDYACQSLHLRQIGEFWALIPSLSQIFPIIIGLEQYTTSVLRIKKKERQDERKQITWAVVVAKLVERLLPIPQVSVSNPVFGKIYVEHLFTVNCIEKTKIKKKYAGNGPFKKIIKFVEGIFFEGNLNFF